MLEHLHPWAEWQALEMRFEGLQACINFFCRVALPTVTCILALQPEKLSGIFPIMHMIPISGTIH